MVSHVIEISLKTFLLRKHLSSYCFNCWHLMKHQEIFCDLETLKGLLQFGNV